MKPIIIIAVYLIVAILFYCTELHKQVLDLFDKIWFAIFWPLVVCLFVFVWVNDKISKLF